MAAGRFCGRLPDADMVRRSYDKMEGSKEIGPLELLSRAQPDEIGVLGDRRGVATGSVSAVEVVIFAQN